MHWWARDNRGKTTLAREVAAEKGMEFITLDDDQFRQFANSDPSGFIRGLERAAIDEIQRAPELILALKLAADEDPRPGRFLITRLGGPLSRHDFPGLSRGQSRNH